MRLSIDVFNWGVGYGEVGKWGSGELGNWGAGIMNYEL
jgi:hypothetical protein